MMGKKVFVLVSATDPQEGINIEAVYDDEALAKEAMKLRNTRRRLPHANRYYIKPEILEIQDFIVNEIAPEDF